MHNYQSIYQEFPVSSLIPYAIICSGVSVVLSSVVKDVDQAVSRNINGAQLLHELLSAPWLCALLKVHDSKVLSKRHTPTICLPTKSYHLVLCLQIYECLLKFQRLTPSPVLPYAAGLSHEVCIYTTQQTSSHRRNI